MCSPAELYAAGSREGYNVYKRTGQRKKMIAATLMTILMKPLLTLATSYINSSTTRPLT